MHLCTGHLARKRNTSYNIPGSTNGVGPSATVLGVGCGALSKAVAILQCCVPIESFVNISNRCGTTINATVYFFKNYSLCLLPCDLSLS